MGRSKSVSDLPKSCCISSSVVVHCQQFAVPHFGKFGMRCSLYSSKGLIEQLFC